MNIKNQNTGGDESSLNGKIVSSNNTHSNITRALLLNSSHNKEIWCFSHHYAIWFSRRTVNILRCGVPCFLLHRTRPSYKHIKLWGVRSHIINGSVTRKKLDDG